ncbi:hypothetical protein H696_03581 [Fonticula alba]|uniref:peptidyl-tRNA hydrolase n=1 Tax=Fonticula alba TaxID=691883 RepID=A0A058Z782_FONAL|nr:hypothetical protein H696_03581 [Fonticula alba]KCV70120.1 hypothetical protein H696_03581 [Fonticula alba]|eukprot:XP_009495726.1 hypothetical protein H696_03581 [Fonticula alba]
MLRALRPASSLVSLSRCYTTRPFTMTAPAATAATSSATAPSSADGVPATTAATVTVDPAQQLVMYIIVRNDLLQHPGWSTGSLIAQGSHAASAAVWAFRDHPDTVRYVTGEPGCAMLQASNGESFNGSMRKVVLVAKSEEKLLGARDALTAAGLDHIVWTELPEDLPTAIATRPYPRAQFGNTLRSLPLFR